VVQDANDGRVLMLAYMNKAALQKTRDSGWVTFFSRSRQTLWTKGVTSGHRLELVSIERDCDGDTLLVQALPHGPACHRNTDTCFDGKNLSRPKLAFLAALEGVIERRMAFDDPDSYVGSLNRKGIKTISQKVGEEGVETALAGVADDDDALLEESADLLFHMMVLLKKRGFSLTDVVQTLESRAR